MTSYDITLSVMGGYINTEQGDPEYGNITVQDLNLFDVAGKLPAKIATIKAETEKPGTDCTGLLAEFTTLCDPKARSCSSTNQYSHQLTTEQVRKIKCSPIFQSCSTANNSINPPQVCNNVDNPKKLLMSAM